MSKNLQSWRAHLRQTIFLSLPLVGIQLSQAAIGITDTIMVGWLGAPELAALVLATSFYFVLLIVGIGFSAAVLPLAATAKGADDDVMLRRAIRMGFWACTGYSVLALTILFNTESILLFAGQDPTTAADAALYMTIAKWAFWPALMSMNLRAFYTVLDRANTMLLIIVLGVILNAVFNYIFIFGKLGLPSMGIEGAATATLVANMFTLIAMVLYSVFDEKLKAFDIYRRLWRLDWEILGRVVSLGFPISMTLLAEVGLFTAASVMFGWIGTLELAAHGIVLQLATVTFMIPLGLSNVATTRVGVAYGRENSGDLKRAAYTTLMLAMSFMTIAAIVFWAMPKTLIALFLDDTGKDTLALIALAVPYLLLAALFQLFDGAQAVAAGILRGIQDTRIPMVIAIFSYWVLGLGASYLLAFKFQLGGVGIWAGLALGLAAAAVLLIARFLLRDRLKIGLAVNRHQTV
ncbi:MAG: MATE family efflux transporter [Hyphomicrobiales bacterium]